MNKCEWYRLVEVAIIPVFMVATIAVIVVDPSPGVQAVEDIPPSDVIEAHAYAMPHQGWAPLTVYFSPFGSSSRTGNIVKYEWDLDANGRFDTDATDQNGYSTYTYKKSGIYRVALKVTDDQRIWLPTP